jgi:septal ring factor EnvC (AmiA/AmiB activator)
MLEILTNQWFTAAFAAIIGTVIGLLAKRAEKAPDMQTSLSAAVASVVGHYTRALESSDALIRKLSAEMHESREEVRALRDTISDLEEHIDRLTQALAEAGIKPPPRRRMEKSR